MKTNNPVKSTTEGFSGSLIPGKTLKIFIVDDDEFYIKLLSKHFSKFTKFSIYEFSNYKDCLAFTGAKPDVAIVDYYISIEDEDKTTGITILEHLRDKYPDIIGFILSGKAGLPSQNEELLTLLDKNLSGLKQRFKNGSYFYFFKNTASCNGIVDILSRLSWKSSGE